MMHSCPEKTQIFECYPHWIQVTASLADVCALRVLLVSNLFNILLNLRFENKVSYKIVLIRSLFSGVQSSSFRGDQVPIKQG